MTTPFRLYAFDFESHLFTATNMAPKPVCWSFCDSTEEHQGVKTADDVDLLLELLEDTNTTLIAHNMPYDAMLMCEHLGVPVSLIQREIDQMRMRDTRVREALIAVATGSMTNKRDPRTGLPSERYSLAECAKTYLKVDLSEEKTDPDAWRLRYSELDGVPVEDYPQEAYDYALLDSVYAMRIFAKQCAEPWQTDFGRLQLGQDSLIEQITLKNEIPQTRASWDLHCMACNGPYRDEQEVETFAAYHRNNVENGSQKLKDMGTIWWNPKKKGTIKAGTIEAGWSVKKKELEALVVADFDEQGVEVPRTKVTEKAWQKYYVEVDKIREEEQCTEDQAKAKLQVPQGNIQTGREILQACVHPALSEYGDCLKSEKLVSTYVPPLEAAVGGRLVSSPNVLVSTGRTSWGKPNMQNPPKKGGFRECFVPMSGNCFASIDYSGIEMVSLAQVLWERHGAPEMMNAINRGIDLHVYFGANIIGKPYEDCMTIRKDKSHPEFGLVTTARQLAKVFNFGSGGGQGAKTFFMQMDEGTKAAMQSISPHKNILDIISDLIKLWKDTWNCWSYFRWVSNRTKMTDTGYFTYQHPISGRIRGNVGYTDGCNLAFQGRSADGAKNAMRIISDWVYEPAFDHGVICWGFVHDEFLLEGPQETVTEWCNDVSQMMVNGMQPYVRDVQVEAEPAAMMRWLKEAEPYYEDEKLIPWDRYLLNESSVDRDTISKECIVQPYYADPSELDIRGPITELDKIIYH